MNLVLDPARMPLGFEIPSRVSGQQEPHFNTSSDSPEKPGIETLLVTFFISLFLFANLSSILGDESLMSFESPMKGLTPFIGDSKKVSHSSPRTYDATRSPETTIKDRNTNSKVTKRLQLGMSLVSQQHDYRPVPEG